ncbi:probable disease resistance protein At5g63020 [Vitis vinifera]|uniref:AAA+ ATPase domain-containing protein n=1 Tax=Vitis vinifera TaxID=29760 RepID=F6HY86_VITVI|nr:probable disease resistance protein At5g63020 [Vitis vinifera]|eukprot:XP_010654604.1 PREDICTED: probable disease resistance protein At5g63020 [Vitis vinifera]
MDCVSPILDVATRLWDCTAKRVVYIRELEKNLNSLERLTKELSNLRTDVMAEVEREEKEEVPQRRRKNEVGGWLSAVQAMEEQVEEILQNGRQEIQQKCLGTCPKNCRSRYRLGKTVTEKINAVTELTDKGHFDVVTDRLPRAPVDERPMGKTVGLDLMFEKVRRCLEDEQVRSIGLYGIGGAGKTTLLKKINNEYFGRSNDFDVVIWVVVSKSISIEKIQEVILKKLTIPEHNWKSSTKEEKAAEIFKLLKAKNFVILLDDMWERLDLLEVGIPDLSDQTKSRVVLLTTRSERVCDEMEVHKRMRVECLTPDEAFSLFCDKVGENILNSHPDIKRLAKIVVEECEGLPLALVVIGRSMASRKTPREWEQALQVLKSYPAEFSGMGDHVFPILKFSYDHLDNHTIKSCFLYCSIFPEDSIIENEELIDLWIGEGFVNKFADVHKARNQGDGIIRSLKLACLLEGDVSESTCKMHDVIRDMALWLSCESGEEKHKSFVLKHVELIEAYEIVKWKEAQRISLWHSNINEGLSLSPRFLNLQTLILRNSNMKSLPIGFFQSMPVIRVLDLSDNRNLVELPLEICRLESLEYLNLTGTSIKRMPIELKNLTKLRCLMLDHVVALEVIPSNVISCLPNLQMFRMLHALDIVEYDEVGVLQELECLEYLSWISITLLTVPAVQIYLTSLMLQKCVRDLCLMTCPGLKVVELPLSTLQTLTVLRFEYCNDLERVKINMGLSRGHISNSNFHNLVKVFIMGCRFLNLTWLIYAPSLEFLSVRASWEMEEIIGSDEYGDSEIDQQNLSIFSRLVTLQLEDLPNLKSIYKRALPFPSLKEINVGGCPNLRKLPLNSNNATNTLKEIAGHPTWWEQLEWEDDNLKRICTPYFKKRY